MRRSSLLSTALAVLAATWLASTDARAQPSPGAALFGGMYCPGGVKELGMPFEDVRLCPHRGYFDYLGAIILMSSKFCPHHTVEAAGQTLPINRYSALFSLFGSRFGGDGKATFKLPDLRGKAPIANPALIYCVVMQANYPPRE